MSDGDDRSESHRAAILRSTHKRYRRTRRPVLLSSIGNDFSDEFGSFKQHYPISLGDFIKENLSAELRFPEGRTVGPRAAVEPIDLPDQWSEPPPAVRVPPTPIDLDKYPRSLLIAFCLKASPENEVYFSVQPPYRYFEISASDPAPGPNFRLIARDLRLGKRSADLTSEDRILLKERIAKWTLENGVEDLIWRGPHRPYHLGDTEQVRLTALQRLIQAQRPEFRGKLLIPADIIEILSQHS